MRVTQIQLSYDAIKAIQVLRSLTFFFIDEPARTRVALINVKRDEILTHRLPLSGADRTDWENNFEPGATELQSEQELEDEFYKQTQEFNKDALLASDDGRILVSSTPVAPVGTTASGDTQIGGVAGIVDTFVVLPVSSTMTVQKVDGGAENSITGSKVEVFYDPNGDLSVLTLITAIFANGSSAESDIDFTTPDAGDGTRRMVLRRSNLTGGTVQIFGQWNGFSTP